MAVGECDACGADLFLNVPHECPVGGNIVLIEEVMRQTEGEDGSSVENRDGRTP